MCTNRFPNSATHGANVPTMVDDEDIYIAANMMIGQHGDTADIAAAQRIDELVERGDLDGAAVWRRILRAVNELNGAEPDRPVN